VQVIGTASTSGFTSGNRAFDIGARYEFHPTNATSPFEDNICTRAHLGQPSHRRDHRRDNTGHSTHTRPAASDTLSGLGTAAAIALITTLVVWRHRRAGSG
jgi:hypothetical protein